MNARSYIFALATCSLVLSLVVAGSNYFIDPYGITGAPRLEGINQYKTDINDRVRLLKKYQPLQQNHNALIVGNSRVELGLSPHHECFRQLGLRPYNIGVPGAGVRRQLKYALNVMYDQPVKHVLISLDFTDFVSSQPKPAGERVSLQDDAEGELKHLSSGLPNPDYRKMALLDYYKALFSLDALSSSGKTALLQSPSGPDRDTAGFNPARDMAQAVKVEGPRALFDQKMHSMASSYSRQLHLYAAGETSNKQMEDIGEFLDIAAARNIRVDVFFNPFHQLFWNLLEDNELMPLYRQWRDSVVALVQSKAGPTSLSLWDFSRVAPYIHEPVPAAEVRSGPLDWFWEPAHYRRELGDLMLDTMLGNACNNDTGIGEQLL